MTDADLLDLTADFRDGILQGRPPALMCFAVSAPLQGLLAGFCGLQTDLVEGQVKNRTHWWNHVWLSLPDGRVLDPTADQFNTWSPTKLPSVYLGDPAFCHRPLPHQRFGAISIVDQIKFKSKLADMG